MLAEFKLKAPSGQMVTVTPDEERDIIKEAIREKILYKVNRPMHVEQAAINAIGFAIGVAVGGLLVSLFSRKGS